jgi:hypothetical protein
MELEFGPTEEFWKLLVTALSSWRSFAETDQTGIYSLARKYVDLEMKLGTRKNTIISALVSLMDEGEPFMGTIFV